MRASFRFGGNPGMVLWLLGEELNLRPTDSRDLYTAAPDTLLADLSISLGKRPGRLRSELLGPRKKQISPLVARIADLVENQRSPETYRI